MRVLILGAAGMLGHKLWQMYRERFDTWITARASYEVYKCYQLFDPARFIGGVEATNFDSVVRTLAMVRPDVVINCIGIIKQLPTAKDPILALTINSLFPHQLANLCQAANVRLIHISTDCVFSGRKGLYVEDDVADAEDLYGRSKYLGESTNPNCLTIRTSLIGRELNTTNGLIEWFLSNRGRRVCGFCKAIYSGFPSVILAQILADILERYPSLSGIYHIASSPIDKYTLLSLVRDAMALPIEIEPTSDVQIDRSLDSSRFRAATGFVSPSWSDMIQAMVDDMPAYDLWRTI